MTVGHGATQRDPRLPDSALIVQLLSRFTPGMFRRRPSKTGGGLPTLLLRRAAPGRARFATSSSATEGTPVEHDLRVLPRPPTSPHTRPEMTQLDVELKALRARRQPPSLYAWLRGLKLFDRRSIREPDERDAYWVNVQRRLAESDAASLMRRSDAQPTGDTTDLGSQLPATRMVGS